VNHYERLAVLAIRLTGIAFVGIGLATFLFGGVMGGIIGRAGFGSFGAMRFVALLPSLFYLAIGVILYAASRPIAAFVARDLD